MAKDKLTLSHKQKAFPDPEEDTHFYLGYWQDNVKDSVCSIITEIEKDLNKLANKNDSISKGKKKLLNKHLKNIQEEMGDKLI